MYLMGVGRGDKGYCPQPPGKQVWQIKRVGPGNYEGMANQPSGYWEPPFRPVPTCEYTDSKAVWSMTGRNRLTFSTPVWGRSHNFLRNPLVDETAPTLTVQSASGARGATVRLPFTVKNDSGRATVLFLVYQGKKIVGRGGQLRSAKGEKQAFGWATPNWAARSLRVCMTAEDEAGNKSAQKCAPVTLK